MRRIFACATVLVASAMAVHAADLSIDSIKDPLPDMLSWHGVTLYGTIDVGYAYQTNGTPLGKKVSGLEFTPNSTTKNLTGKSISTIDHSNLGQSNIGLKIEESLDDGWKAIGKLETGFDPLYGEFSDGCRSFVENAGVPYAKQTSNGDTGRCGQSFNSVAYAGVSNASYGTLTFGRQYSFQQENVRNYDPFALSYAFSLFGYSGTASGSGSTQASAWDNSVKYVYQYGPLRAGAMFSNGGDGTGMFGEGYGFNVGGSYQGFALDAVYNVEHGAVNLSSSINDTPGFPLAASISDNEAWTVVGKYTYEFDGGLKDGETGPKLTFYGGYTHINVSNPDNVILSGTTNGGYAIGNGKGGSPDNNAFTTTKVLEYIWTGAKYELPSGWSFTAGYYRQNQDAFIADSKPCPPPGGVTASNCVGHFDQGSILVDYQINKHFDVYGGVTYGRVADALAAGFQGTPSVNPAFGTKGTATSVDTAAFVTGMRLKF